ncbi:UNVERIFIED_CONTAM: hypothetical protein FKN15_046545 [Acipenser sinensis]
MIKINKGKRFQQAVDAVEEFLKKARGREQQVKEDPHFHHFLLSQSEKPGSALEPISKRLKIFEEDMGSTSIQAADSTAVNGSIIPTDKRYQLNMILVLGPSGVLQGIRPGKCYVEMSTVDPDTVTELSQVITSRGGRFLEAPVSGSQQLSNDGMLVILAAGDRSLYEDCSSCFQAMGKTSFFLGEVGNAAKMMLILNMVHGSFMATIAEGLTLAQVTGQSQTTFLDILSHGQMASTFLDQKCQNVLQGNFKPDYYLKHIQKDLRLAIAMGDSVNHPTPMAAAANEEEEFQWLLREEVHAVLKQLQDILKDINIKMAKSNRVFHFTFREDKQWKMQQIQDARNHVNQALQLLSSRDESYRFKTGAEVDKVSTRLLLPHVSGVSKNLEGAASSRLQHDKALLEDTCFKTALNVKLEVNALKFEVSHVHKVECMVPWLNDTLVFFTISLQLCQQLKDKLLELQTFLTQSAHFQYCLSCGAMLLLFH